MPQNAHLWTPPALAVSGARMGYQCKKTTRFIQRLVLELLRFCKWLMYGENKNNIGRPTSVENMRLLPIRSFSAALTNSYQLSPTLTQTGTVTCKFIVWNLGSASSIL